MNDHATTTEHGSPLRELFLACLDQPDGEPRRRYLESVCAGDASLRQAVEALLASHREDNFLEQPAVEYQRPPAVSLPGPAPGSWIGPYRLVRELGAGGCGLVFAAEQEQPVRRRVALKVIKPGMDSRAVIARFEVERQALALMEHPHIARVLDAGTTSTGQPFFVMDLVEGVSITRFCDGERLDLEARLRLFLLVAAAVEHAHARGIIHRDLKPSNILVSRQDGQPWPRIIDFGVAKAVGPQLGRQSSFTLPGGFLGTPAYMSPEQADLKSTAVDRRSDVYSLGALLYELLVGVPPFDPKRLAAEGLEAMRRAIREQDPVPPSVSLQQQPTETREQLAARRGLSAERLARELRQEADWIILKALEKEPGRRYDGAAALAADVRRMLEHEPVQARPPGRIYRFRKRIRRHPLVFATAAAFLLPLMLGVAAVLWQAHEKAEALAKIALAEREEQLQRERLDRLRNDEVRLRQQTESLASTARRKAYAADLNFAQQALAADNLGRAVHLLDGQRPAPQQPDLRGWEWRYLWQLSRSEERFTLGRLTNEVRSLGLSPDGEWLVTGEESGEAALWSLSQRRQLSRLPRIARFHRVTFSPVASLLAYPVEGRERRTGGEVLIWSAGADREVARLNVAGPLLGLAFARDGQSLMTATPEGKLERWSLTTFRQEGWTQAGPARLPRPAFAASADLSRVAYVTADEALTLFDTRTGAVIWKTVEPVRELQVLRLSPDERTLLATVGPWGGGALRRWSVADGRELPPVTGHTAWVADVAYVQDGSRFVSAGADQTLRIWRAEDGELLRTLRGHEGEVRSLALSGDGARLVSGGKDGVLKVWDLNHAPTPATSFPIPGNVRTWNFAAADSALVTLDDQGAVRRWVGGQTNAPIELLQVGPTRFGGVMSADATLLANGTRNGQIAVWNLRSGGKLAEFGSSSEFRIPVALLPAATNLISFQPRERTYTRWSLPEGRELESWPANASFRGFNISAVVEPAGQPARFASITTDGQADLRAIGSGQIEPVELGLRQINGMTFSPDGSHLAVSSGQGRAVLWQLNPPRRRAEFGGFLLGTHGLALSPNGERLAVTSLGREAVKLFDVETQAELLTLSLDGNQLLNTVRFSPDGRWLGASSPDGQLRLWRAPSWEEIAAAEQTNQ